MTTTWWEEQLPRLDAYISRLVLAEVSDGDPDAAARRLAKVKGMALLADGEEVDQLAELYRKALGLPVKAVADAYHMAIATINGMDYIVSWNCKHIASARVRRALEEINARTGYRTPCLCTPEELTED